MIIFQNKRKKINIQNNIIPVDASGQLKNVKNGKISNYMSNNNIKSFQSVKNKPMSSGQLSDFYKSIGGKIDKNAFEKFIQMSRKS